MPKRSGLIISVVTGLVSAALAFVSVPSAHAVQYATSKSPYWRVGDVNKDLSSLCQRRLFNQMRHMSLHIGYIGGVGKGITGIAKKGWNLHDPTNVGVPGLTYHFFNDGYSNCKVFTAGQPTR
ncbi:MAG: hypothetical protein RIB59_09480 [Rhodospirillales bacterium]